MYNVASCVAHDLWLGKTALILCRPANCNLDYSTQYVDCPSKKESNVSPVVQFSEQGHKIILESRKKNGNAYPNTLYQLICSLQHYLRENEPVDIKMFEKPNLHGFRTTLDSEMKCQNATGNCINKCQAQPITNKPSWELGFPNRFSYEQEHRSATGDFSLKNPAL